jgi:hypothetical protein
MISELSKSLTKQDPADTPCKLRDSKKKKEAI